MHPCGILPHVSNLFTASSRFRSSMHLHPKGPILKNTINLVKLGYNFLCKNMPEFYSSLSEVFENLALVLLLLHLPFTPQPPYLCHTKPSCTCPIQIFCSVNFNKLIIIISLTSIFFQDKSRVWTAASQQH